MYTVMGITGQIGGVVGHALLAANQPVRAVVRDAGKGRAWADRGCKVALATIEDAASLTTAFRGAEGVFVLVPSSFDPTPGFPEARTHLSVSTHWPSPRWNRLRSRRRATHIHRCLHATFFRIRGS